MADLIDAVIQISTPVKLAWIICLVWAVAQREWYRRARSEESEAARREAVSGSAPQAAEPEPLESDGLVRRALRLCVGTGRGARGRQRRATAER